MIADGYFKYGCILNRFGGKRRAYGIDAVIFTELFLDSVENVVAREQSLICSDEVLGRAEVGRVYFSSFSPV